MTRVGPCQVPRPTLHRLSSPVDDKDDDHNNGEDDDVDDEGEDDNCGLKKIDGGF